MNIDSISAVPALGTSTTSMTGSSVRLDGAFDALVSEVSELSAEMKSNASAIQRVALGDTDNLHQVMINMERTRLQFDLLLQVRNKVLEAYQELMRMQI